MNVTPPSGAMFREFVAIVNDDTNLVLYDGSTASAGNSTYAVNYGSEPMANRWSGDLNSMSDYTRAKSNTQLFTNSQLTQPVTEALLDSTDPQTPIFVAEAGSPVRFRWLHSTTLATQNGESITLHGHVWQEEPFINDSTGIGYNPMSQWFGIRDKFGGMDRWEMVLGSAGGKDAVPGDYLYSSIPVLQQLGGVWGVFRVVDGTSDSASASIRDAVLEDGRVLVKGLSPYDPVRALFIDAVTLVATGEDGREIPLGEAAVDVHTGLWSFIGASDKLQLGMRVVARTPDGRAVSAELTRAEATDLAPTDAVIDTPAPVEIGSGDSGLKPDLP
jgi:hypothetical protein